MTNLELKQKLQSVLTKSEDGKYDLLPVYADPALFAEIVEELAAGYEGQVDYVVAPEAMGWVLGAAVATKLGAGFAGVRKLENSRAMKSMFGCRSGSQRKSDDFTVTGNTTKAHKCRL